MVILSDTKKFNIRISCIINLNEIGAFNNGLLSSESILKLLNDTKNNELSGSKRNELETSLLKYKGFEIALWQLQKIYDINILFYQNLNFNIDSNNTLNLFTGFDLGFTDDFNESDVAEFIEGFGRYSTDILDCIQNEIMYNFENGLEVNTYYNLHDFYHKLRINSLSDIKKITK